MRIKDRFLIVSFSIVSFFVTGLVWADLVEPQNPTEAMNMIGQIFEAFKSKNWIAVASLIIMILVYAVRMLGLPLLAQKPELLAVLSQFMGCLVAIAAALYANVPIWQALVTGLFLGAAASGFWSSIFKYLLPTKKTESLPEAKV
jgi:hypothetical protein